MLAYFRASLLALALAVPVLAQDAAAPVAVDRSPWLFKGSDIPPDPAWKFGTLPSGLRYAVRRNGVPPGQVSVRVRIDAGSLYEKDGERGFAHLLEHLSFRGSEYVPDGEAKRVWQRFGATFGSDSNAQTTPTQTVYKLDLPSATETGLDESLKILKGMMDKPAITKASLDAERAVVLAEQREQPAPQVRVGDAQRGTLFAGQPLADRSPIGTTATLNAATAETVAAFHDRWYRPERAVVVVSGDMDPALLERLVIKNFAPWTEPGGPTPDPDFGKPTAGQPATGATVEASLPTGVTYAVLRPWVFRDDTVIFNQNRMVDTIATLVINRRLETRARGGASFLTAQVNLDDIARSVNGTFVTVVPIGDDWEAALADVRAVIADAERTPPTQGEIDLATAQYDTALRTQVETAGVEAGGRQADDLVSAVDIRETVAGPGESYRIFTDAKAKRFFTPARVLESTQRIFKGDATRAFLTSREPVENVPARLQAALNQAAAKVAAQRKSGPAPTFAALPKLGPAGKVVGQRKIEALDLTEATYANGVKALIYASPSEVGRVYVRVRFGGGRQVLPADRWSTAWAAPMALVASGIGSLDQEALDRMTAGRRIGLDFGIDDDAFVFGANTSPADFADQLKLIAAKLAAPRWDAGPFVRARAATLAGYNGLSSSPEGVIQRDLDNLLHARDPRWGVPPRAEIEKATAEQFKAEWAPLLATGPIEVQVFGDVTAANAMAAIGQSLGALKPRTGAGTAAPIRFPAHVSTPVVLRHDGADTQAAAVIAWPTGGGTVDIAESRRLEVLAAVFTDRLFEGLRSVSGASYSPSVQSSWPTGLPTGGRLSAAGQVAPDRVDFFLKTARDIAADLVAKPLAEDELKRTLAPIGQYLLRASTGNMFWLGLTEGATRDERVYDSVRSLGRDYGTITPAQLQETARKYLRPDTEWSLAVLPEKPAAPAR